MVVVVVVAVIDSCFDVNSFMIDGIVYFVFVLMKNGKEYIHTTGAIVRSVFMGGKLGDKFAKIF